MFHPYFTQETSFGPLFRLLDDFENYERQAGPRPGRRGLRHFTPRFDMRETENTFELHGELPGITKENIAIDFTDPQTIVIKGKVERQYEAGTPPAGYVAAPAMSGAITEGGETESPKPHKATVEDAGEEGEASKQQQQVATKEAAAKQDKSKYWYSERSFGEFSRTFGFPCLVDHDNVTASLKDGILNVSIPKAKKPTARRVNIL